jgi:hypothetical protein
VITVTDVWCDGIVEVAQMEKQSLRMLVAGI